MRRHAVPGLGLARPVQRALRAGASSARRALLRALGWGSRLALKEKPTKPNQTKPHVSITAAHSAGRFCSPGGFIHPLSHLPSLFPHPRGETLRTRKFGGSTGCYDVMAMPSFGVSNLLARLLSLLSSSIVGFFQFSLLVSPFSIVVHWFHLLDAFSLPCF